MILPAETEKRIKALNKNLENRMKSVKLTDDDVNYIKDFNNLIDLTNKMFANQEYYSKDNFDILLLLHDSVSAIHNPLRDKANRELSLERFRDNITKLQSILISTNECKIQTTDNNVDSYQLTNIFPNMPLIFIKQEHPNFLYGTKSVKPIFQVQEDIFNLLKTVQVEHDFTDYLKEIIETNYGFLIIKDKRFIDDVQKTSNTALLNEESIAILRDISDCLKLASTRIDKILSNLVWMTKIEDIRQIIDIIDYNNKLMQLFDYMYNKIFIDDNSIYLETLKELYKEFVNAESKIDKIPNIYSKSISA